MRVWVLLLLIISLYVDAFGGSQTDFTLTDESCYFQPAQGADWLDDFLIDTFEQCAFSCHSNKFCRTFDYNVTPKRCRLFQVDPSGNQILCSQFSHARAGIVYLNPKFYNAYNKTCDFCQDDRYLFCINGLCRCSFNAYWDGTICQKQKYAGESCSQDNECRTYPYNLTCNTKSLCFPPYTARSICSLNRMTNITHITGSAAHPYTLYGRLFVASTTSVTVQFSMKKTVGFWLLDDGEMWDITSNRNLIQNGDFETGTLAPWNYCDPYNTQNGSAIRQAVSTLIPNNGLYYYGGSPSPDEDYLSQVVPTTIGHQYNFSFWLRNSFASISSKFTATIYE